MSAWSLFSSHLSPCQKLVPTWILTLKTSVMMPLWNLFWPCAWMKTFPLYQRSQSFQPLFLILCQYRHQCLNFRTFQYIQCNKHQFHLNKYSIQLSFGLPYQCLGKSLIVCQLKKWTSLTLTWSGRFNVENLCKMISFTTRRGETRIAYTVTYQLDASQFSLLYVWFHTFPVNNVHYLYYYWEVNINMMMMKVIFGIYFYAKM